MKIIFIAGPLNGDGTKEAKLSNIEVARGFVRKFIDNEVAFYSPHLNLDQERMSCSGDNTDYAISMNRSFFDVADAIAVLPGWESSSGTKGEIERATERDLDIFYLEKEGVMKEIVEWSQNE